MKIALTIAASDSSSGAGIQADLAVFRAMGVYGVCAVTLVTAQNSQGVHKIYKVAPRIVTAQIDDVTRDFNVDAAKIGMLFSPRMVEIVSERIARREIQNVVLDPLMKAKNGEEMLQASAIKRLKRWLIPKVAIITPNADEAKILTGITVNDVSSASDAAKALVGMGAKNALVKGGHIEGEPVDVLFDGTQITEFPGKRFDKRMHGTGCVLSAAIAARLALGDDIISAITSAKDFVGKAIENSIPLGKGRMDYFFD